MRTTSDLPKSKKEGKPVLTQIENTNPNPVKPQTKNESKRPRVPKATDLNKLAHHEQKNYLCKNAIDNINAEVEKSSGKKEINAKTINPSYGKVPEYLSKMKEESIKKAEE